MSRNGRHKRRKRSEKRQQRRREMACRDEEIDSRLEHDRDREAIAACSSGE